MRNYTNDNRIVLTLDAGGQNFVFNAISGNQTIHEPIRMDSNANDLDKCLKTIIDGFTELKKGLPEQPVAISFAFPGPSDYPNGIMGDLCNLPAFRGGVALKAMLEEHFKIPVFLNNDGDLFAYGEALAGFLPNINNTLKEKGSVKQYKNLLGVTLGTGFGGGIVLNGQLLEGDNSAGGEIWVVRNKLYPQSYAEEGCSTRAITYTYTQYANCAVPENITPKDVYEIAKGMQQGDDKAAREVFDDLGEILGDALANAITLIDGLIVIGGGISAAADLFLPRVVKELNSKIYTMQGKPLDRLEMKAFNLNDEEELNAFCKGEQREIKVPFSDKTITYDPMKRIGVGVATMDTSKAVAVGAYNFALNKLDS